MYLLRSKLKLFIILNTIYSTQNNLQNNSNYPWFQFSRDVNADDVIFNDYVIFDVRVRSPLDCSSLCFSTFSCEAFTYITSDLDLWCRGYDRREIGQSSRSSEQRSGSRTFVWNHPRGEQVKDATGNVYIILNV